MKKILLIALALFSFAGLAARAEENIEISYCGPIGGTFGSGNPVGTTYGQAIEIPAVTARTYEGCDISAIEVGFGTAAKCEVEVFVSTNLSRNPLYTQTATVKPNQFTTVKLDTPYKITGEKLFVGYRFVSTQMSDSPMAFDYDQANKSNYGNYVSTSLYPDQFNSSWEHYYAKYGNVCVRALLTGTVNQVVKVTPVAVKFPPLSRPGKEFEAKVTINNASSKEISGVEIEWVAGSNTGIATYTFDAPVRTGGQGIVPVRMKAAEENDELPVTFTVTQADGEANTLADQPLMAYLCNTWNYAVRNVMVEKFTGPNCGYCPLGLVAFEEMDKNITDGSFIGVAVENYNNGPMYCSSYEPWSPAFGCTSAPTAVFNRNSHNGVSPSYEFVMGKYDSLHKLCYVGVDLQTVENGGTADVTAKVHFYKDYNDIDYGIGFVLTENNVGPYYQNNNYSGGGMGPCGGFENMSSPVQWTYNNVAREIFDWQGATGAIPSDVKAGAVYEHSRSLSLSRCGNLRNVNVIAFVTDTKTGEIVNAIRVPLGESSIGVGVEEVGTEPAEVKLDCVGNRLRALGDFTLARVYALDGRSIGTLLPEGEMTLSAGIYVIKIEGGASNDKIFKVMSR